ncbi:DUF6705 family protein [Chryseobacterium geocarposphaerae]|uniref:DUF6705 domain-containing protein n=1 Tax=Chryseobacterium geocarposphaerae TaxID=1416776 RepID=A0A2M9C1G9_9FLAO|nr:DUF6705 family protein [Chryseobacterium geocarposphaerae]PJJ64233.1 hypothetical protein CLV73_2591 [Chryseobacterium geocarposphaerae]
MKNLIILLFLFVMISCKSQSPIYTLGQSPVNSPENSYLKDTDNVLNKFVGTWTYNKNGKIFTIILNKAEMVKIIDYYVDELQGNYIYTINGNTVVNTNTSNFTGKKSRIFGFTLWEGNTNKVTLYFKDPERPRIHSKIILTYSNQNGIEKLHWDLKVTGIVPAQGIPGMSLNPATDVRVPTDIELIKQ